MDPIKQRIAIAEACGWKIWNGYINNPEGFWVDAGNQHKSRAMSIKAAPQDLRDQLLSHIPDYLNDLNAMHEAWCALTKKQHQYFRHNLRLVVQRDGHTHGPAMSVCNATAAQRAESFLRTIGKWEGE